MTAMRWLILVHQSFEDHCHCIYVDINVYDMQITLESANKLILTETDSDWKKNKHSMKMPIYWEHYFLISMQVSCLSELQKL